jgi:hypothetical protein
MTEPERPRLTDDAIRSMLETRAQRSPQASFDADRIVTDATRDGQSRPTRLRLLPRVWLAAGTAAAAIVVAAVIAIPIANRPADSASPTGVANASAAHASPSDGLPSATIGPDLDGIYPGGIPRSVGGEPVVVGLESQQRVASAVDATPFLVGGWYSGGLLTCTGGIGPRDPNPLGARGCPRYFVPGMPGYPFYPEGLAMPEGDNPIVLRVHTHDRSSETCWNVPACRARVVVDEIAWFGDASTVAAPMGPGAAMGYVLAIAFADQRPQADKSVFYVHEDMFTLAIACPDPWPTLLFSIHGDPRLSLMAVFADVAARKAFEAATDPGAGIACLAEPFERAGQPRWISRDNVLVLAFSDAKTAAAMDASLNLPAGEAREPIPLPDASLDLSLETLTDYLKARASGETDHAAGERLVLRLSEDDKLDVFAGWQADSLRRLAANALRGTTTLISDNPTEGDIGPELWRQRPKGSHLWLYRVDYAGSTDPGLASETFVVVQDPASTFRDWQLVRIAGEPFPIVMREPEVPPPSGFEPMVEPILPSHDKPCLPAGTECG